ncbi:peptidase [Aureimonas sp. Leaf454]|nr:peptidase [Aureimonas sp. Leaf454]
MARRPLAALAASVALVGFLNVAARAQAPNEAAVVATYSDLALAGYEDALASAKTLKTSVDALIATPSEETLGAARAAWTAARPFYQQTEAFRFGNPIVDDWEGRVNAWPLDEGLIDYVAPTYGTESDSNAFYVANVIAHPQLTLNGETIDATVITPTLLKEKLQEAGGVEANVATGYHAIEFLLWGQDLNGTGPGAGKRPATDYSTTDCTNGHCDRRAAFLKAASDLLVADLEEMVGNWTQSGAARKRLTDDPKAGVAVVLTGMGSLSYGELAGERMKLGLLLHDPEEEHDCFSDNTHVSHLYDAIGIRNVYTGRYVRLDGSVVEGPSVSDLVAATSPEIDTELKAKLDATVGAMEAVAKAAQAGEAYDQQIAEGNVAGNARVQAAIDGLIAQTRVIERAVAALEVKNVQIEGSDSLDNVNAVFQ